MIKNFICRNNCKVNSKDRKIRSLKRRPLCPRIISIIITDLLILFFTSLISYLALIGLIGTNYLKNNADNERFVSVVNSRWSGNKTQELDESIDSLKQIFDTVQGVYIVDSDFNILANYGVKNPDFTDIVNEKKALRSLKKGDAYIKQNSINEHPFEFSEDKKESAGKIFHRIINLPDSINDSDYIHWANTVVHKRELWTIYNTDMDGVYVCINNVYPITNFQLYFFELLGIIFVAVSIVCAIYHNIRFVTYIVDSIKRDKLIYTDWITGGKNQYWFVEKAKSRVRSNRRKYAIVQIRLEKYRNYCTSYGVEEGEHLLESINKALENLTEKREISAHIENSDFALLLVCENQDLLNQRVKCITEKLTGIREHQHLTFVAGAAEVPSKEKDIDGILSESSLVLGKTEESGTDILWFNDSMREEQVWERRIEDDMEKALENHEFKLYLQPKYATKTETLAAAEALVRWQHHELGLISPGKFIPIFESNGFILKLDDYMLTEVVKQQAKWMEEGKQLVPISVNVSRAHFTKDDLAEHICSIVDEYKVPHKYIELELTESAFFDDKAVLLKTVQKLKDFDFVVSMDDFGAGYSSLNSLKELPLDVIKLDAEFFRGKVDDVNRANLIVSDTITLAKKLGMQIVAEGIETREQVDFLADQQCDLIQGFYFAKPLPVTEFEERAYPSELAK